MSNFKLVGEFHTVFKHPKNDEITFPDADTAKLRLLLLLEEVGELVDAMTDDSVEARPLVNQFYVLMDWVRMLPRSVFSGFNPVETADALTDILYVTYGAGHAFGLDLDKCMKEVHRSNMSKLQDGIPVYHPETGKVMKGDNYSPPDLRALLYGDKGALA